MEKHKCKLCARTFSNGRALGGHMKGHLSNHPLPPKTTHQQHQLSNRTDSASSSSSSSGDDEQDKSLAYGLRENPKKSFRFADPEFSFAGDSGSVVQDRESETESRNPTRRRSKRKPKVLLGTGPTGTSSANATTTTTRIEEEIKKPKMLMSLPSSIDSPPTEPEPVSSVSDTSPDEDVAMCLMLLSRDAWKKNNVDSVEKIELKNKNKSTESSKKKINGKRRKKELDEDAHKQTTTGGNDSKRFECPFCYRVFGSGQALGGHKRSHLLHASAASSSNNHTTTNNNNNSSPPAAATNCSKFNNNLIDLNMPAPAEDDDEFSVVSVA